LRTYDAYGTAVALFSRVSAARALDAGCRSDEWLRSLFPTVRIGPARDGRRRWIRFSEAGGYVLEPRPTAGAFSGVLGGRKGFLVGEIELQLAFLVDELLGRAGRSPDAAAESWRRRLILTRDVVLTSHEGLERGVDRIRELLAPAALPPIEHGATGFRRAAVAELLRRHATQPPVGVDRLRRRWPSLHWHRFSGDGLGGHDAVRVASGVLAMTLDPRTGAVHVIAGAPRGLVIGVLSLASRPSIHALLGLMETERRARAACREPAGFADIGAALAAAGCRLLRRTSGDQRRPLADACARIAREAREGTRGAAELAVEGLQETIADIDSRGADATAY
jgi:hypothetical protein